MKRNEKNEIKHALFKEASNKKCIIENCNKILDAKLSIGSKVENDCKLTINRRKFAIISVACLILIATLALIIFIPPIFKNNGQETYYFNQNDLTWEDVNDIENFIIQNNLPVKRFADNLNNFGKVCYYRDKYVGLLQDLLVINEGYVEIGTVLVYKSHYVIQSNNDEEFDKVIIAGIEVEYHEYKMIDEIISEFTFSYNGFKYYYSISSITSINLEYYVKQVIK